MTPRTGKLRIEPATAARWQDLECLFGERGACGGCWCMLWRLDRAAFERGKGAANRAALRKLVRAGAEPGLLGYDGTVPVAWCAVGPRSDLPALARSRILAPVDDQPVWSVSCLFVRKEQRGRGRSIEMLRAATDHVRARGGRIVEGYPCAPRGKRMPAAFAWTGIASAFERAGFTEVARRSAGRPIMRRRVRPARKTP